MLVVLWGYNTWQYINIKVYRVARQDKLNHNLQATVCIWIEGRQKPNRNFNSFTGNAFSCAFRLKSKVFFPSQGMHKLSVLETCVQLYRRKPPDREYLLSMNISGNEQIKSDMTQIMRY